MDIREIIQKGRQKQIQELADQSGLHTIYLLGSRAQEFGDFIEFGSQISAANKSDLDVGLRLKAGGQLTVADKVHLATGLEEFFAVSRVDLVLLHEANPFLAANIIRGIRFYTIDDYEADEYELYALRRAGDLAHFERQRQALILGQAV